MADKLEKWELAEIVDDAVACGFTTPEMVNEFVYEFKTGGRVITDLTAASYHQIALQKGINTVSVERELPGKEVIYTVICEFEGQQRYGVSCEPLFDRNGNPDRFAFQKALTKATRNAIKQFVSATERFDTILKLKALPMGIQDAPVVSDETPAVSLDAAVNTEPPHRERCSALWKEHGPDGTGYISENFWTESVSKRFGVKSKDTMTAKHWQETLAWMQEIIAVANVDRVRKHCFAQYNQHGPEGTGKLAPDFWERMKERIGKDSRKDFTYQEWQRVRDWLSDMVANTAAGTFKPDADDALETTEIGGNGE